jgi:hypothetical protein
VLVFYGRDVAPYIDPGNYPFLDRDQPAQHRWDTDELFRYARSWAESAAKAGRAWSWRGLGFEVIAFDGWRRGTFVILGAPFWAICLPLAVVTAWGLFHWRRQHRWRYAGRCPNCGYDLRASTGACPECGTSARRDGEGLSGTTGGSRAA